MTGTMFGRDPDRECDLAHTHGYVGRRTDARATPARRFASLLTPSCRRRDGLPPGCPPFERTFWGVCNMGRVLAVLYGVAAYAFFLATFVYAIFFVEGIGVPKTIDSGLAGPIVDAVIINL